MAHDLSTQEMLTNSAPCFSASFRRLLGAFGKLMVQLQSLAAGLVGDDSFATVMVRPHYYRPPCDLPLQDYAGSILFGCHLVPRLLVGIALTPAMAPGSAAVRGGGPVHRLKRILTTRSLRKIFDERRSRGCRSLL